jgi:uncharacterized membrane protein
MAAAALAAGIMNQLLPDSFRLSPHWVYPVFLVGFLVVLIAGDPGFINRERRWLRLTTEVMIALITLANAVSAVRLVVDILTLGFFDTAGRLLGIGAVVWLTNVITFALWYWDLDGGGSAARAVHGARHHPALVFPEMTLPELAPAHWYPQFVDYLAFSFNTATTFGPADVSAIKRWAKLLMVAESLISLALATLVISRAINIA